MVTAATNGPRPSTGGGASNTIAGCNNAQLIQAQPQQLQPFHHKQGQQLQHRQQQRTRKLKPGEHDEFGTAV